MKKILVLLVAILFIACSDFKEKKVSELIEYRNETNQILKDELTEEEYRLYQKNGKIILREKKLGYLLDMTVQEVIDY